MRGVASRRAVSLGAVLWLALAGSGSFGASTLVNRPAPEFSRPDLNGAPVSLAGYRGKVVLLNFWATWCGPCRVEIPRFMEWQQQDGPEGLQVLGISIDDSDTPVRAYVREHRLNYPVVMGDARLGALYGGIYGVPVTFLIDRAGIVRARFDGEGDWGRMESEMRKLLAGPSEVPRRGGVEIAASGGVSPPSGLSLPRR